MACKSCNDCNDQALNLPGAYGDCIGGEPCEEVLSMDCSKYKGLEIVDIPVKVGERLSTIVRRMLLNELYPTCVQPSNPVMSVVDVATLTVTDTEIEFEWTNPGNTGNTYTPEIKVASSPTWTQPNGTNLTVLKTKFINLVPETAYHFRVLNKDVTGATTCNSLIFKVTTLETP